MYFPFYVSFIPLFSSILFPLIIVFFVYFHSCYSIFPFSGEQVRVVLFRECDEKGRLLLFDSSAVQKVSIPTPTNLSTPPPPPTSHQCTPSNRQGDKLPNANDSDGKSQSRSYIDICNGYGYIYDQTSCEANNIGEMVFGSVAMSFKGTSLKVMSMVLNLPYPNSSIHIK